MRTFPSLICRVFHGRTFAPRPGAAAVVNCRDAPNFSRVKTVPRSRHPPTHVQLRGCATVSEHSPERQDTRVSTLCERHPCRTSPLSSLPAAMRHWPSQTPQFGPVGQPGRQLCSSGSFKRVPRAGTYEIIHFHPPHAPRP